MLKALVLVVAGYFVTIILSALLGVFSLAFVAGFLSNQSLFFYRLLIWAGNVSEIWYSLKHRHAFKEIRSRESELEAEIARLKEELKHAGQRPNRPRGKNLAAKAQAAVTSRKRTRTKPILTVA